MISLVDIQRKSDEGIEIVDIGTDACETYPSPISITDCEITWTNEVTYEVMCHPMLSMVQ